MQFLPSHSWHSWHCFLFAFVLLSHRMSRPSFPSPKTLTLFLRLRVSRLTPLIRRLALSGGPSLPTIHARLHDPHLPPRRVRIPGRFVHPTTSDTSPFYASNCEAAQLRTRNPHTQLCTLIIPYTYLMLLSIMNTYIPWSLIIPRLCFRVSHRISHICSIIYQ